MPKLRKLNISKKEPPKGFENIKPVLIELQIKLKEITSESNEGKRKEESLWPIFKVKHQMSRYIYDLYYNKKEINKNLFDYCIEENWADKILINKWKKQGYEKLCCLMCIQQNNNNFNTTCICRVPKKNLFKGKNICGLDYTDNEIIKNNNEYKLINNLIECKHCGCRGCASSDV